MKELVKKYTYEFLTALVVIGFIICKIPYLNLPYYWDEMWVYAPAIQIMAANKLSLLPDALPVDYSRGHPLLFHFLGATWIRLFGTSGLSLHSFAMSISIALLIAVFQFGKTFFNARIGFLSVAILCLQPFFFTQSSFVLPEIMLALFTMTTFYFYLKRNYVGYFLSASALILTKESGIVFLFSIVFIDFIFNLFVDKKKFWQIILSPFKLAAPLLVLIGFLLIQKSTHGWYFFPEHIAYIKSDPAELYKKFKDDVGAFLILYQGRNALLFGALFTGLILIVFDILKKKGFTKMTSFYQKWFPQNPHAAYPKALLNKTYILLITSIFLFIVFTTLNFFTNRYLLCVLAPFVLVTCSFIFKVFQHKYYTLTFLLVFSALQVRQFQKKSLHDSNLGYVDCVKTNMAMVNYCNEKGLKDKKINTFFLMTYILRDSLCGYVSKEQEYTGLMDFTDETEYRIISNYDTEEKIQRWREQPNMSLVKRIETGIAWIELYEK